MSESKRFVNASIVLAVAVVLTSANAGSQELNCQTNLITPDPFTSASITSPYGSGPESVDVRLRVNILRDSSGQGGLSTAQVDSLLLGTMMDFEAVGIRFTLVSTVYIDDSNYYVAPLDSASALFAENSDTTSLNLYLGNASGSVGGKASGIPGNALVLTGAACGTSALSHLIGHCFGLHETDEAVYGAEAVGGEGDKGDLVYDTDADPGLSGWVETDCDIDPAFFVQYPSYDPDPENIMSGSCLQCLLQFSSEQADRMLAGFGGLDDLADLVLDTSTDKYQNFSGQTAIRELTYFPSFVTKPRNAAVFDFSGDQVKDLMVCGGLAGGTSVACRCLNHTANGVPIFTDDTQYRFETYIGVQDGTTGLIVADYDNDGFIDFYAPNPFSSRAGHRLYRSVAGVFHDVTSDVGLASLQDYREWTISGAWGDYDGDSFTDLLTLCRRETGSSEPQAGQSIRLYRNITGESSAENGEFTDVSISATITPDSPYVISALWADFDQDYDVDLVMVQSQQTANGQYSRYLENLGNGTFYEVTANKFSDHVNYLNLHHCLAALADVDNDADIDFVYHSPTTWGYFANNFNGGTGNASLEYQWSDTKYNANLTPSDLDAFDYDLDGRIECLVSNSGSGLYQKLLHNEAVTGEPYGLVEDSFSSLPADTWYTYGVGAADCNLDGYTDIYLSRPRAQNFFFKAGDSQLVPLPAKWIGIRVRAPVDGDNNLLGIGATVIITQGTHRQAQVVDGGSGRVGQHDLDLVFGLGTNSNGVDVEILWPNGNHEFFENLATNQYHTLVDEYPEVDDLSVSSTIEYDFENFDVDWIFTWKTNCLTDATMDTVRLFVEPTDRCFPGHTYLTHSTPGVVLNITEDGANYLHTLEWEDVECEGRCSIGYEVTSGQGKFVDTSDVHRRISIPMCVSGP